MLVVVATSYEVAKVVVVHVSFVVVVVVDDPCAGHAGVVLNAANVTALIVVVKCRLSLCMRLLRLS